MSGVQFTGHYNGRTTTASVAAAHIHATEAAARLDAEATAGTDVIVEFRAPNQETRFAVVGASQLATFNPAGTRFTTAGSVSSTDVLVDEGQSRPARIRAAAVDIRGLAARSEGVGRSQGFGGAYRTFESGMSELMPPNTPATWTGHAVVAGGELSTCVESLEAMQAVRTALSNFSTIAYARDSSAAEPLVRAFTALMDRSEANPNLRAMLADQGFSAADIRQLFEIGRQAQRGDMAGAAGAMFSFWASNPADMARLMMTLRPLATLNIPVVREALQTVNREIFTNIAPAFQAYQAAGGGAAGLAAVRDHQPPLPPEIIGAFDRYARAQAMTGSDPDTVRARAELVIEGNQMIAHHEQTVVAEQAMARLPASVVEQIDSLTPLMYAPVAGGRHRYVPEGQSFTDVDHRFHAAAAVIVINGRAEADRCVRRAQAGP